MYKVIATAFRSDKDLLANKLRNVDAKKILSEKGFKGIKDCVGYYQEDIDSKPSIEESMVIESSVGGLNFIEQLFFGVFKQDSILVMNEDGYCQLVYATGGTEFLGWWTLTSKEQAYANGAFTFIGGSYYVAS